MIAESGYKIQTVKNFILYY